MANGARLALAVVAGLGLFGAVVLAVPPGRTVGSAPAGPAPTPTPAASPGAPSEADSAPAFDAVRVEPDGAGLAAGRAEPGARVEVVAGGAVAGAAVADADGRFVAFLDLPPSPDPRGLSLRDDRGGASAGTVIVGPLPAVAGPAAGAGPAVRADAGRTVRAEGDAAAGAGAAVRAGVAPEAVPASEAPRGVEAVAVVGGAVAAAEGGPGSASRLPEARTPGPGGMAASPAPASMPEADDAARAISAPTSVPTSPRALAAPAPVPAAPRSDPLLTEPARPPVAAAPAEPAASPAAPLPAVPAAAPGPGPTPGDAPNPPGQGAPPDPRPAEAAAPAVALASPAPAAPAPEAAGQPPVLLSDEGGMRVIQPALAPGADAELLRTVALDAIAYDDRGAVVLQGRAAAGRAVRLYLDGAAVADAAVGEGGGWSTSLPGTAPGVYTLRVDEIDDAGAVLSRIETPFQREAREDLAALMAQAGAAGRAIATRTVQPGNTLWAIARDRYGRGTMYVTVFAMNRDRIRDPDLIYPGQVFVLPATDGR